MSLMLIAPPAAEPVSLAELKDHLKIDGAAEDALLTGFIVAARQTIEAKFQIAIVAQTWRLTLEGSDEKTVLLPISPVLSIDVVGIMRNGVTEALSPGEYDEQTGTIGRVRTHACYSDADLVVTFTAGWSDVASVPEAMKLAIKLLAAHYYENREGAPRIPDLAAFVAPYRQVRL